MTSSNKVDAFLTVDVEEWFHILDDPAVPAFNQWAGLESRLQRNMELLLLLLDTRNVKATMFWLGWAAEKHPELVRRCAREGHEIASHGYRHILAYESGREKFKEDIRHSKKVIEDIIGQEVVGFRAAGFGTTADTPWFFDEIRAAGFLYDSSVFPAKRGHGGIADFKMAPHEITTTHGVLLEVPQSVVLIFGKRVNFFGGGYLRIAPIFLIRWGIHKLQASNRPLIVYVHPREVDPAHPRLPLKMHRRFKSYVNLRSTVPKLHWLCKNYEFGLMKDFRLTPVNGEK